MHRIFFLLILLASCEKGDVPQDPLPLEPAWQAFHAGQEKGDSVMFVSLGDTYSVPLELQQVNDSLLTDTLSMDMDSNQVADLLFIYKEEYPFWNPMPAGYPPVQSLHLWAPFGVMLVSTLGSAPDDMVFVCDSGMVINDTLAWIWEDRTTLCRRQLNSAQGNLYTPFFVPFKMPYLNALGWIKLEVVYDDYYYKKLVVHGYALKQ